MLALHVDCLLTGQEGNMAFTVGVYTQQFAGH